MKIWITPRGPDQEKHASWRISRGMVLSTEFQIQHLKNEKIKINSGDDSPRRTFWSLGKEHFKTSREHALDDYDNLQLSNLLPEECRFQNFRIPSLVEDVGNR